MIRVKSINVRLDLTSPPLLRLLVVLAHLDEAHQLEARPLYSGDLVVTSANDSKHSAGSRHYTNEAIDVRAHNFRSREAKREFRRWYEEELGPQFRVLLEAEGTPNEHFHAQVRKGLVYREDHA